MSYPRNDDTAWTRPAPGDPGSTDAPLVVPAAHLEGDDLTHDTEPDGQPGASTLVHAITEDALAAIDAVTDPAARSFAAEEAIEAAEHLRSRFAGARRDAVRALRGTTRPPARTWEEVGALIGTSGARAQKIADLPADRNAPRGPRG